MAPRASRSSKKQHKLSETDAEDERDVPDRRSSPHKALIAGSTKSAGQQDEDEQARRQMLRFNQPIVEKILLHNQVKALVASGIYTTAKARQLVRLQKAHPERTTSVSGGRKKGSGEKMSSFNPYDPYPRGKAPIVLGTSCNTDNIVTQKIRFDDNHIFCVEYIPLEKTHSGNSSFPGWSIKRLPTGEPDEREYVGNDGKIKKRFNFSGTMKTLNDLHTGLKFLKRFSEYTPLISKQAAMSLEEDEHGIVDISAASKPTYSNDIMDFGQNRQYRMYIDRHTYTPPSGNTISYMALILCKRKTESAKKKTGKSGNKSGDDEDYFQIVIPVSRLDHLLIAVEMAMETNNIKPVEIIENSEREKKKEEEEEEEEEPMDDQNEVEGDDDDEVMVVEKKKKKKKRDVKKRKRTLSPESDTDVADSDDDRSEADSGSSTDADMEEEEKKRKKRRTGRVIKKNRKYD